MLHIHEDSGPHLARGAGAGAGARAPLKSKGAMMPSAAAPGKQMALPKPRRALGDITNKDGKQGAQPAGGPAAKQALKPRARQAPADFDPIERMFPAPPPDISLDMSGIDLDAIVDAVLKYDHGAASESVAPAAADVADDLGALRLETDHLALAPELAFPGAPALDEGGSSALAGELPDSVEVDESGVVSDSEEEMELE